MKKLFLFLMLSAVFFECKDDEAPLIDLTGTWTGLAVDSQGGDAVSVVLNHDTITGNVTGSIFASENDTITLSGYSRADRFTGIAYGNCTSNVDLDIRNGGNKLDGQAVDRPAGDSCQGSVELTLYRVLPPNQDVTGTWSGTFSGSDGNGTLNMTLTQTGAAMSGTLLANDGGSIDTNTFVGTVIGDAMLALASKDSNNSTWILVDVTTANMDGIFAAHNKSSSGSVHISKTSGKIRSE